MTERQIVKLDATVVAKIRLGVSYRRHLLPSLAASPVLAGHSDASVRAMVDQSLKRLAKTGKIRAEKRAGAWEVVR